MSGTTPTPAAPSQNPSQNQARSQSQVQGQPQMAASTAASPSPLQYLDRAMTALRDLGLVPSEPQEAAPIVPLLDRISDLDPDRIAVVARTLNQASLFNEVVREQVSSMEVGERYEEITDAFNSIRDDARGLVGQIDDGRVDTWERLQNVWMKISRGDIATRFDKIKETYLEVAGATNEQIARERLILDAYRDFRGAMKEAEIAALEVLGKAEKELEAAKAEVGTAMQAVAGHKGEAAERARLEMTRDEKVRALQDEEQRYQIAKDLSDNLTIGYNTSEVIMARLLQTTTAKERIYAQSVSFFNTNETVLTALSASFTGMFGLHESTKTLDAMKEGVSASLETLSEIGGKVQEEALRAGYGPTVRADAVKKLVESVVGFQERSRSIIEEMRVMATRNSTEIREAVEDGKRRLASLAEQGNALLAASGSP